MRYLSSRNDFVTYDLDRINANPLDDTLASVFRTHDYKPHHGSRSEYPEAARNLLDENSNQRIRIFLTKALQADELDIVCRIINFLGESAGAAECSLLADIAITDCIQNNGKLTKIAEAAVLAIRSIGGQVALEELLSIESQCNESEELHKLANSSANLIAKEYFRKSLA